MLAYKQFSTLEEMNNWILDHKPRIVSVETVYIAATNRVRLWYYEKS